MKYRKILIISFFCSATFLFFRDFFVYMHGGRPWLLINDEICGIFFTPHRNWIVASCRISENRLKFPVVHKWRGRYQIVLRTSYVCDDFTMANCEIGAQYSFTRGNGSLVYESNDAVSSNRWWMSSREQQYPGSEMRFKMYSAPRNVPLDENLVCEVEIKGNLGGILTNYQNAYITVEKRTDK